VVSVVISAVVSVVVSVVITMLDHGGDLYADLKLRAATAIDPDSVLVIAPGAILDALGFALLVDHLNATAGIRSANVAVEVV